MAFAGPLVELRGLREQSVCSRLVRGTRIVRVTVVVGKNQARFRVEKLAGPAQKLVGFV
jgi:hypothetical protein